MSEPFYENGLNFECTQCSKCCRFDPGYVFLSYNDLNRLISFFNYSETEFIEKYCRKVSMGDSNRLSLIEKSNYDCIFWKNGGCEIYEARPLQCRSYPFWKPFLEDKKSWDAESLSCSGMNHGTLVSKEAIDEWLLLRDKEEYILV
ncbi:MAG: YkgJ family cysteine cluster protein [Spirochaetales bacterium]|nr:YkgJ family cysteine cluster protein [Spirochaetales bacterium]